MFTRSRILRGVMTPRQAMILAVCAAICCLALALNACTRLEEPWPYFVCHALVPVPLLIASVIDAACHRLPDPLILSAAVLAFLSACALGPRAALHALVIGAVSWASAYLLHRVTSLGRGDVKLVGALGLWLADVGLVGGAIILGVMGAGMWAGILVAARRARMTSYLALGPWLAGGGIVMWALSL